MLAAYREQAFVSKSPYGVVDWGGAHLGYFLRAEGIEGMNGHHDESNWQLDESWMGDLRDEKVRKRKVEKLMMSKSDRDASKGVFMLQMPRPSCVLIARLPVTTPFGGQRIRVAADFCSFLASKGMAMMGLQQPDNFQETMPLEVRPYCVGIPSKGKAQQESHE